MEADPIINYEGSGKSADPDVWWGPDGTDALLWGDGIPYIRPPFKSVKSIDLEAAVTAAWRPA